MFYFLILFLLSAISNSDKLNYEPKLNKFKGYVENRNTQTNDLNISKDLIKFFFNDLSNPIYKILKVLGEKME